MFANCLYYLCKTDLQIKLLEINDLEKIKDKIIQQELDAFQQLIPFIESSYRNIHLTENPISKWKGIDIIYFQEDLRKIAKGSISEKSFYTYFKNKPSKPPRIDVLNMLSIYAGYKDWNDFKRKECETKILDYSDKNLDDTVSGNIVPQNSANHTIPSLDPIPKLTINPGINIKVEKGDNHSKEKDPYTSLQAGKSRSWIRMASIIGTVIVLSSILFLLFYPKQYIYCFNDMDRNGPIQYPIDIQVFKENESPLYYKVQPGQCLNLRLNSKILKMKISSPLYESREIVRVLEDAPSEENIALKPDDYKMAVDYFSKKDIDGKEDALVRKRAELNRLISDDAVIFQVFDNEIFGIETMNKAKYITLVTTPTTALKNLKVLEMKKENGKIVSIKFKITPNAS